MKFLIAIILIFSVIFAFWKTRNRKQTLMPIERELEQFKVKNSYITNILVSGLMHHEFDRALSEGFVTHISHFQLRRQPTHPSDPSAVAIYTGRFKIGYVPVRHVQKIAEELDRGDHFGITLSGYYPYKIIFEQLELRLTNQTLQSSLSQPAF